MEGKHIWIVAFNKDYNEASRAFSSPCEAVVGIAEEMGRLDLLKMRGADAEFWHEVDAIYEAGAWKGLSVHRLDAATLEMTSVCPDELHFARQELGLPDVDDAPAPG